VLLDEKRTKRLARIMAVFTALAFVGGGIVLILVSAFGSPSSSSGQLISDAQAAVKSTPNNVQAWDQLATAYQAASKNSQAITAAQHATALDPADKTSAFTLVALYSTTGQYTQAINVMKTYTAKVPSDPDGWGQLGQFADDAGEAALAYTAYAKYIQLAPPGATPNAVKAHLPALAKVRSAQAQTTAHPKVAAAWDALAAAYLNEQNITGALTAALRATTLAPTNAAYMDRLASVYTAASQSAAAVELATQFTKRNPKVALGFYYLGTLAQQARQSSVAKTAYEKYLQLAPNGPKAASVRASLATLGSG
jgi:cytochrome c-type biogenesis protein CcmH/NrfG